MLEEIDKVEAKAEALVKRLLEKGELPLLVMIGLGDGHILDALGALSPTTRLLAVEPEPSAAQQLTKRRDWNELVATGRAMLLAGPDYTGSSDAFRLFPQGVLSPSVITAPGLAQRVSAEAIAQAKALVSHIVGGVRANDEARRQFAGRYLLNTLRNLPDITAEGDVAALFNAFAGLPAIVVGAGPSLDRNIAAITRLAGQALIIAVDTACRPLLAAGIHPHLVVSVDPTEINATHLAGLPDTRGIWFVAEGSIDSSVFPQFRHRTFTFKVSAHHPWPFLAAHGADRGKLQAWGSVLTTAFDLAVRAGCEPIVFAGADLAYTDGLQYCRNTVHESKWAAYPTDRERAEHFKTYLEARPHLTELDVSGKEVISTPPFVQFRDWIVAQSGTVHRRVVNATGGGILHGGSIELGDINTLDLASQTGQAAEIQERLHQAWGVGADQRRDVHHVLDTALAYGSAVPLGEWFSFGGDTATALEIAQAAQRAGGSVATSARLYSYLQRLRDSYDTRIHNLEDAQTLSHGDYDTGARQAVAQQAPMLLDVLQRRGTSTSTLPPGLKALDVGCGVGRQMVPLVEAGWQVDGVDISRQMLAFAGQNAKLSTSRFFLASGIDCGGAPDGAYDLVYSQLCFRYLTARLVRRRLLAAMVRALRPDGLLVVEMRFFPRETAQTIKAPHVPWNHNGFDVSVAPCGADVRITPADLHFVYEDFSPHLRDLRLQFVDMPAALRLTHMPHLIVSGSPRGGLWEQMNGA